MATVTQKLTYEEFAAKYGDKTHEYWYGEAIPKGMPTWVHGLLRQIIGNLLREAGFFAGSEIELRIDLQARPCPDVIASSLMPRQDYPTQGLDVVVEVVSEDDKMSMLREKCQKYQEWHCQQIYLVDPADRSVVRWENGSLIVVSALAGIPVSRIWQELDSQYDRGNS